MTSKVVSTLAFVCLLSSFQAHADDKTFDRTFAVAAGGRLGVEMDVGSIAVTGGDSSQVVIRIKASGSESELENLSFVADKSGSDVTVTAKRDSSGNWLRWWFSDVHVSLTVEVPREYNLDLQTSGGGIKVRNLDGTATGRTSGGHISLEQIKGAVNMRTSGGRITMNSVSGPVDVHTSGGRINAEQVDGGLRAHTSGGSIHFERISGPIEARSSGGSIDIELVGENEGIVARTSGGSITLRLPASASGTLNASTSGGSVSSDMSLTRSEVGKSSLRGTLNDGGPEILARTSGGSIRLVSGG
jgi:DUF4097 and DUF4098 domain-containing protein YvlB